MKRMLISMCICGLLSGCLQTPAPTQTVVTVTKEASYTISEIQNTTPMVTATIKNTGNCTIKDVVITVIIYQPDSTYKDTGIIDKDELKAGETANIIMQNNFRLTSLNNASTRQKTFANYNVK